MSSSQVKFEKFVEDELRPYMCMRTKILRNVDDIDV